MQLVLLVVAALAGLALATSIPNEYVAVFAGTADSNAISQHMARVAASGAQVLFEYNFGDFRGYSLRVPEGSALSNAQFSFLSAPEVAYYEQNQVYHTMAPVFRGGANQTHTSRARVFAAECNLQEEATWGLVRTSEKALYIDGAGCGVWGGCLREVSLHFVSVRKLSLCVVAAHHGCRAQACIPGARRTMALA